MEVNKNTQRDGRVKPCTKIKPFIQCIGNIMYTQANIYIFYRNMVYTFRKMIKDPILSLV